MKSSFCRQPRVLAFFSMLLTAVFSSCFGAGSSGTSDDAFRAMMQYIPVVLQPNIKQDDPVFSSLLKSTLSNPDLVVWINKKHALPADYVPRDLVPLSEYAPPLILNKKNMELNRTAADALVKMALAAKKAGITLDVSSAYRSYDYQKKLFNRYVNELGEAEASRQSARAGTSQHQLGTTVDFGSVTDAFADTKAGKWLSVHAWEYGFSLSYPQGMEEITGYMHESWHYRFIGSDASRMEHQYFNGMQEYLLEFLYRAKPAIHAWLASRSQ